VPVPVQERRQPNDEYASPPCSGTHIHPGSIGPGTVETVNKFDCTKLTCVSHHRNLRCLMVFMVSRSVAISQRATRRKRFGFPKSMTIICYFYAENGGANVSSANDCSLRRSLADRGRRPHGGLHQDYERYR